MTWNKLPLHKNKTTLIIKTNSGLHKKKKKKVQPEIGYVGSIVKKKKYTVLSYEIC